ncbi:MAG: hypothetical protein HDS95_05045 [Bacteroidales bacterium]|nr:hypothetical protein [Bacteroidales bacterium]
MKYPLFVAVTLAIMLYTALDANAVYETGQTIMMVKVETSQQNKLANLPKGKRMPSKTLRAEISLSGIYIPGVDNNDIISFEIYTSKGICMGIFSEEMDFIETLFSLSGEYEIRIVTEYATFAGIIEI